jgi:hypothetical protein
MDSAGTESAGQSPQRAGDAKGRSAAADPTFLVLDDAFLARTYRTTAVVAGIVFVWVACLQPAKAALNFALGAALSLALLRVTELSVKGAFGGVLRRGRWAATAAHIAKFGFVGVGFWALFRFDLATPEWLAAGYSLLLAVVALKVAGALLNCHLAQTQLGSRTRYGG